MVGLGAKLTVMEDKEVNIDELDQFEYIVFSPGPGLPKDTHSMFPVLERFASTKKILGICLGMQGIAEFYGATLYNQKEVKHGVVETIKVLSESKLFLNIPKEINVGLYHSWAVDLKNSESLKEIAKSDNCVVMAIEHKEFPVFGVQFHPESILTPYGKEIIENFLFDC